MNQVIEVASTTHRVELQHPGMIFSVARYISRIVALRHAPSRRYHMVRLRRATEPALKDGDLVEVVNDAIGVLATG